MLAPEEILEDAEVGEVLEQAADEYVDSKEGLAVTTVSSEKALKKLNLKNELMKPQNLLIGAGILFLLYRQFSK